LSLKRYLSATADSFLTKTIKAVLLTVDAPTLPVCRVPFPGTISLPDFKEMIASALVQPSDPETH
jgi:hypothetical protein